MPWIMDHEIGTDEPVQREVSEEQAAAIVKLRWSLFLEAPAISREKWPDVKIWSPTECPHG